MEDGKKFKVELVKDKKPYWFTFPQKNPDCVEIQCVGTLGMYTYRINQEENVPLYQYVVIFMVISELYLSVQHRTVHKFHRKSLPDINYSRKQMAI